MENERKRQDVKFKKLDNGIENEPITNEEREEILRRHNDHLDEKARRRRQLKRQGKEVRDTRKRRKLNDKFEYLNEVLKKVKVEESERTSRSRQILVFDLTLKDHGHTFTAEEFLEIVKPYTLNI